jgi:Domain of unknown function (DUF4402)
MKKLILIFAAIVMVASFSNNVVAQVTKSDCGADAELVVAMTITETTPLNFGVISTPAANGGSVAMTTANVRTPSGTGVAIIASGTAATAAEFTMTGTTDDTYSFTLPASITVSTDGGGGTKDMTINAFVVNVDGAGEVAYGSIGTCTLTLGTSTIFVGGTITIQTAQDLGLYVGTYEISVDYL